MDTMPLLKSPFSRLRHMRKLALHMRAVSLVVLTVDILHFMKSISGTGSLENYFANIPAPQHRASGSLLSRSLLPMCLYLLLEVVWVPVMAHRSRRPPWPPFEGQMPEEPGVGVEMVCVIKGIRYRISQFNLQPKHNWIMSKKEKVPRALAVSSQYWPI